MSAPASPRSRRHLRVALIFLLPNFLGFLVFTAGPVLVSLGLSFTSWDLLQPPRWVGLDNFIRLLGFHLSSEGWKANDPEFWKYLGNTFVDIGELSLAEAEASIRKMARLTSEMFDGMVDVLGRPNEDLSLRVSALKGMEDTCDTMLHDITAYLIECSTHEIGAGNATRITAMLRVVAELEEATDRIYRLVKVIERKYRKGRDFSEIQHEDLTAITVEVQTLLEVACNSLGRADGEDVKKAQLIEDRVDGLRKRNNKAAAVRMQQGTMVQTEMIFIDMNNHLEAVANHALNVVQAARRETA